MAPDFGPARFPSTRHVPDPDMHTELASVMTASPGDHGGDLLNPENPLVAFAAIAAVVFGLMAFSTSVRVGKTKAGITIGDTK